MPNLDDWVNEVISSRGQGKTAKPEICKQCPAYKAPGPVNSYPATSQLKLVACGEAPGDQEVQQGRPFYERAPSGGLLWKMMRIVGLRQREEVYTMNVARCITKDPIAFLYCWKHFGKPEVDSLPPDVPIVAFGTEAKNALLPELRPWGITVCRGTTIGRVTVALHPSFIRRTARAGSEETTGGESKQDLEPTLAYDIDAALHYSKKPHSVEIKTVLDLVAKLAEEA